MQKCAYSWRNDVNGIEKPSDKQRKTILDAYEKDIDTGSQVIETVEWATLSTGSPIAKLDL